MELVEEVLLVFLNRSKLSSTTHVKLRVAESNYSTTRTVSAGAAATNLKPFAIEYASGERTRRRSRSRRAPPK